MVFIPFNVNEMKDEVYLSVFTALMSSKEQKNTAEYKILQCSTCPLAILNQCNVSFNVMLI